MYSSDRGGVFGTAVVSQDIDLVRASRQNCLPGVKPIAVGGGGSVCVQRQDSGEVVVANLAARGRVWMVLIAPESPRPYKPELSAMMALAGAAPK